MSVSPKTLWLDSPKWESSLMELKAWRRKWDRFVPLLECSLMWRWQWEKYAWVCGMAQEGQLWMTWRSGTAKLLRGGHMSWGLKNSDGQLDKIKKIGEMTLEVQENESNKGITPTTKTKQSTKSHSGAIVRSEWLGSSIARVTPRKEFRAAFQNTC